jgi:hypothetical protein
MTDTNEATSTWRSLLAELLLNGRRTEQASAGARFRGRTSLELLAHRTVWPVDAAIVACPGRKLGYRFLAAEAAWVLSGDNRLAPLLPYAPSLAKMSDDGVFLAGAYGPPFTEQLPYIVKALSHDCSSRQAVATLWRPRPMTNSDTPCTTSLQYLIRDEQLHCIATMRSNDVWLGTPYDIHTFAMATAYLALHLNPRPSLGQLYLTAGSQHLYVLDREPAETCAKRDDALFEPMRLDLADFARPEELIEHLWSCAKRTSVTYGKYLEETTR